MNKRNKMRMRREKRRKTFVGKGDEWGGKKRTNKRKDKKKNKMDE